MDDHITEIISMIENLEVISHITTKEVVERPDSNESNINIELENSLRNSKNNIGAEKSNTTNVKAKKREKKKSKYQVKNAVYSPTSEIVYDSTTDLNKNDSKTLEIIEKQKEEEYKDITEILKLCENSLQENADGKMLEEIDADNVDNQLKKTKSNTGAGKIDNANVDAKRKKKKKNKNQKRNATSPPISEMVRNPTEELIRTNDVILESRDNTETLKHYEKCLQESAGGEMLEESDAASVDKRLRKEKTSSENEKSDSTNAEGEKKKKNQERNATHTPTFEMVENSTKELTEINEARLENIRKHMENKHKDNTEISKHYEKSLQESANRGMLEEIDATGEDKRLKKAKNNTETEKSDSTNGEVKKRKKKKNKNQEKNATCPLTSEVVRNFTEELIGTNDARLENMKKCMEKGHKENAEIIKDCEKLLQKNAFDGMVEKKDAVSVNNSKNNSGNEKSKNTNAKTKNIEPIGPKRENLEEKLPHPQTFEVVHGSTEEMAATGLESCISTKNARNNFKKKNTKRVNTLAGAAENKFLEKIAALSSTSGMIEGSIETAKQTDRATLERIRKRMKEEYRSRYPLKEDQEKTLGKTAVKGLMEVMKASGMVGSCKIKKRTLLRML